MIQRAKVGQNSQSQINGALIGLIIGVISGAIYAGIGGAIAGGVVGLFLGGLVGTVRLRFGRRTATVLIAGIILAVVIFLAQNLIQSNRNRPIEPVVPVEEPIYNSGQTQ